MQQKLQNLLASLIGATFLIGSAACPPTPPDPGPAPTPAEAVCAKLAEHQCPEGLREDCMPVVQKIIDTKVTDLKVDCLLKAQTSIEIQACGTVACRK